jgi:hypothetical protein
MEWRWKGPPTAGIWRDQGERWCECVKPEMHATSILPFCRADLQKGSRTIASEQGIVASVREGLLMHGGTSR